MRVRELLKEIEFLTAQLDGIKRAGTCVAKLDAPSANDKSKQYVEVCIDGCKSVCVDADIVARMIESATEDLYASLKERERKLDAAELFIATLETQQ